MAEQGLGWIVNRQALLRATKGRELWRTMIIHVIEEGEKEEEKIFMQFLLMFSYC